MARYIREVELNKPEDFVQYIMTDFLSKHSFRLVEFKGEMVYRAGGGLFEIPKFLTWGYQNGTFHVEAWTRNCWFPGVYGAENAMDGFIGCIPKGAYKKDIEQLIGLLFQPLFTNGQVTASGQSGVQGESGGSPDMQMNVQQPIYVKGTDISKYAVMSLVFSLVGLVLSCLAALLGFVFGTLGIVYGKKGMNSQKKGMATAGFVIGILADVIAAVIYILNLFSIVLQLA